MKQKLSLLCAIVCGVFCACVTASPSRQASAQSRAIVHYAQLAHAAYEDSLESAKAMDARIGKFLRQPSAQGLEAARHSWMAAHAAYGRTEAFRFFGGPIDDARGLEKRINTWPIDASYLDYVQGDAHSGLINHPEDDAVDGHTLTAAGLAELNGRESERNVSVGFHAIEFLLWGEDHQINGAGDRPFTDYVNKMDNHGARRATALAAISALLVQDLSTVRSDWETTPSHYGSRFIEDPHALQKALVGFVTLAGAELGGERLSTALSTQRQEEEESCFSDTTTDDIKANVMALQVVWTGNLHRLDGSHLEGGGLRSVVQAKDRQLAGAIDKALAAASIRARALHAPFDQEIVVENLKGQERLSELIASLDVVSELGKQAIRQLSRDDATQDMATTPAAARSEK